MKPAPGSSDTVAVLGAGFDVDTTWREVFDVISDREQACIRSKLGDRTESVLDQPVMGEAAWDDSVARMVSCLDTENARAVLLLGVVTFMDDEYGELSKDSVSCLRERIASLSGAEIAAVVANDQAAGSAFFSGAVFCLPDLLILSVIAAGGLGMEDLSEEEASCLRGWATSLDPSDFAGLTVDDPAAVAAVLSGAYSCIPDR